MMSCRDSGEEAFKPIYTDIVNGSTGYWTLVASILKFLSIFIYVFEKNVLSKISNFISLGSFHFIKLTIVLL